MKLRVPALSVALVAALSNLSMACTGISLPSQDQDVVAARTVEWALSDAQHYRMALFPRHQASPHRPLKVRTACGGRANTALCR